MMIYTLGHSTRSLEELIGLLDHYKIKQLVDIRTVPRSRHTPQFNSDNLNKQLPDQGIAYQHLARLGGLRHAKKDNLTNAGWRNASFRGYADYMQTEDFAAGLEELLGLAASKATAIMCAEAVPWRCHRSMVGDALLVRGHEVVDIFDENKTQSEKLTSFARVEGSTITYPPEE